MNVLSSNAPTPAAAASTTTTAASTTVRKSAPFSLSDRLVWVRPLPNSSSSSEDDDDDDDATTANVVTWVPALHYVSHTEMLRHHPHAIATVGQYNKAMQRRLTLQYLQEVQGVGPVVPLVRLLWRWREEDAKNDTPSPPPPKLEFQAVPHDNDAIQWDFWSHLIHMNHPTPDGSGALLLLLYKPQHLTAVHQLLQDEADVTATEDAPSTTTTTTLHHAPPPTRVSLDGVGVPDATPRYFRHASSPPHHVDTTITMEATSSNVENNDQSNESTTTTVVTVDDPNQNPQHRIQVQPHDSLAVIKQKLLQVGGWTYRCWQVFPTVEYHWIPPPGGPPDSLTTDAHLVQYLRSVYPHWTNHVVPPPPSRDEEDDEEVVEEDDFECNYQDDDVSHDESHDEEKENDVSPAVLPNTASQRRVSVTIQKSPRSKVDRAKVASNRSFPVPDHDIDSDDDESEIDRVVTTRASRTKSESNHQRHSVQPGDGSQKQVGNKRNTLKPVPKKKKQAYAASPMTTPKRTTKINPKKKSQRLSPHWWKHETIPSAKQIRPILQKLGFTYDPTTQRYQFPSHIIATNPSLNQPLNMGYNGLRKFLCRYGIPPLTGRSTWSDPLSEKQQEVLRRWIVFANVPTKGTTMQQELRKVGSPKKTEQLITKLYSLGFSTVDGKLFVPEYKQMSDYRNNPKPIHETHFFYRETELYTKVRWYIRHSWRLGVVTMMLPNDDGADPMEHYRTDQERIRENRKYYETLLFVRLWAAASSQPIPTYSKLPDEEYLEPYFHIPDDDDDDTDNNNNEDSDEEDGIDDVSGVSSSMSAPTPSSNDDDDDINAEKEDHHPNLMASPGTSVTSIESDCSSVVNGNDREWFLHQPIPDFGHTIWRILVKLNFQFRSGSYGHPDVPEPIGNLHELRQFCARYGIPDCDRSEILTKKDRILLFRWAAFAHVNVRQSRSMEELRSVKRLKTVQVLKLLTALKFQTADNKIYIPGADYMEGGRSNRKEGTHYFIGLEGIRGYIRGAPELTVPTTTRRKVEKEKAAITNDDMLALRLWAAMSDRPLPTFEKIKNEPKAVAKQENDVIDVDDDDCVDDNQDDAVDAPHDSLCDMVVDVSENSEAVNAKHDKNNWHTPSQGSIGSPSRELSEAIDEKGALPLDIAVDTKHDDQQSTGNPMENDTKRDIDLVTLPVVFPPSKRVRRASVGSVLEMACSRNDQDDDVVKNDRPSDHSRSTQDGDDVTDDGHSDHSRHDQGDKCQIQTSPLERHDFGRSSKGNTLATQEDENEGEKEPLQKQGHRFALFTQSFDEEDEEESPQKQGHRFALFNQNFSELDDDDDSIDTTAIEDYYEATR